MASVPELIYATLEELKADQLSTFQWFLCNETLENHQHVPKSKLEKASKTDTVDVLVEMYGINNAITVTLAVLTKMKLKHRADILQEQYLKVATGHNRTPTESQGGSDLNAIREKVKSTLKKKYQNIYVGNSEEGYNIYLKKIYTELQIIEGGVYGALNEHTIEAINLFKTSRDRDKLIRTVLTLGIPGVGKTVCAQKFALNWAEGDDNQDIILLFPIPFRELNPISNESYSLMQLLHQFFPETKALQMLGTDLKVLLIFDGLDESNLPLDFKHNKVLRDATEVAPLDVIVTNLVTGDLLNNALIWITSRPVAANKIPRKYVQQWTEIKGFTAEKMEEYFKRRLPESSANKLISHVKSCKSLYAMCQIPVFCSITITVATNMHINQTKTFPRTLTEMYVQLLRCQTDKLRDRDDFGDVGETILKLAALAFRQLEKEKLIFYESDLRECNIDIKDAAVYSGVCTEVFRMEGQKRREVFTFVHLTVQEFLAALFAHHSYTQKKENVLLSSFKKMSSKLLPKSMFSFYRSAIEKALQSPNGHWDVFLRFLLGLSHSSIQELLVGILDLGQEKTETSQTIEFIKAKIKESPEVNTNLFQCLGELKDESLVQEIQSLVTSGRLAAKGLTPVQWSALNFELMTSEATEVFDLKKYAKSEEGMVNLRATIASSTRALLDNCSLTESCGEVLAWTLSSSTSRLKELDLSENPIKNSGLSLLCVGLRSPLCKLEQLRLQKCELTAGCGEVLAEVLCTEGSRLRLLDLSLNNLHDSGLKSLSVALTQQHCKLHTLRLKQCKINDKCAEDLASVLSSLNLRELDLSHNSLRDRGVSQFSTSLKSPHCKLEILRISSCELTQKSATMIGSVIGSDSTHLKELDLSYNNIQNIHPLCEGLRSPVCRLQTLRLNECNLHSCCENLGSVFSDGSSKLKELDLSGNYLLDLEIQLLCAALSIKPCKLDSLSLSFCGLTEKSCTFFSSVLRSGFSELKQLDLSFNFLQDSGVQQLSVHLQDPLCKLNMLRVEPDGECYLGSALKKYACDLSLDVNTAGKSLSISEGGRRVTWVPNELYEDCPERFQTVSQVLCHQALSHKHYWEVEWTGRWVDIAVAQRGIRRQGSYHLCSFGSTDQSWRLFCGEQYYSAQHSGHNGVEETIPAPRGASRRIGVYLDWPAGTLSYYIVRRGVLRHLYTFYCDFTEPLLPGFGLHEEEECSVTVFNPVDGGS